ncbi:hypothetical protein MAR_030423 [Mya arenaria]|uniref:Uncharacterized protein n=1 Tax=Mya arenaria TaxID=6604 RepID=A0ABY7F4U2_MYAAR|nr:hypothetical protein MAR_030423 [Mya arenaria]
MLPRDHIDVVIAIPNIQEPDGLADNDSEDSGVPQASTSLADSMKTDLSEPNANVETMTEFTKKDVGTMAHNRGINGQDIPTVKGSGGTRSA